MLPYVTFQSSESFSTPWLAYLVGILRLEIPVSSELVGLCAVESLTAFSKAIWEGFTPFAVGLAMLILVYLRRLWRQFKSGELHRRFLFGQLCYQRLYRLCKRKGAVQSTRPEHQALLRSDSELEAEQVQIQLREQRHRTREALPSGDFLLDEQDEHYVDDARALTFRARCYNAANRLGLLAYSVFLSSVVKVLHCVTVPGGEPGEKYLFIQGTIQCAVSGWQLVFWVFMVLLCVTPVAIAGLAKWAMRNEVTGANTLSDDVRMAFRRSLVGSFVPHLYMWEVVLMTHRLTLAVVYTFYTSSPVMQTAVSSLLCVFFLAVHARCHPMRDKQTQDLQTLLLSCLCVAVASSSYDAAQLQLAASSDSGTDSTSGYLEAIVFVFGYVIPIAAFVLAVLHPWLISGWWQLRIRMRQWVH